MKPKILLLLVCFTLFYFFDHLTGIFKNVDLQHGVLSFFNGLKDLYFNRSFVVFAANAVFAYLVFYKVYPAKGTIITILVYVLAAIPLMIGFRFLLEEVIFFGITGQHNYNMKFVTAKFYIWDNIYFTIYFNVVSMVFFGIQYERFSKLRKQELELQARNAELSFLKSQINPHFLFNNLNSIYTLVYQQSANALPAIGKLSELLRYMLYQKEDVVLLSQEIRYLHNFIDLQTMRYDFTPHLKIDIQEGLDPALTILPLTLIPFVENAFKHGDLKDPEYPVQIRLETTGNWLHFTVGNKKNKQLRDETGGIGLENVKKRLALLKFGRHELQIKENEEHFNVSLKMMIHE